MSDRLSGSHSAITSALSESGRELQLGFYALQTLFMDQEGLALLLSGQASKPTLLLLTEDPFSFLTC